MLLTLLHPGTAARARRAAKASLNGKVGRTAVMAADISDRWPRSKGAQKQERRSFGAPPPCAISASRPFGTLSRIARPFGLWITRLLCGFPQSGGATRPQPLFSVALLRRDSGPGRAGTATAMGFVTRRTLAASPYGMRSRPLDRSASRLLVPSPLAAHGIGRPRACLPSRAFRLFPGVFGFLRRHLPQPDYSQEEHT